MASQDKARVMVVHSYGSNHICGAPQAIGVVAGLAKQGWEEGNNLYLESFYMDTKKTYTTPAAIKQRGKLALDAIDTFGPDVVIVLDDNAIREVMLPLVGNPKISLVFSGMNGQPEAYHNKKAFMDSRSAPGSNVTGVYEKLHVYKSLMVMSAALGGAQPGEKVIGITDYSPTGNAISKQFDLELKNQALPYTWELRRVRDFEEYKKVISEINTDPTVKAIYPAALSLKTVDNSTITAGKIFQWTTKHSTKPEMALNYFFSKIGLFGGAAVDFTAMGQVAGIKAGRILNKEPAGSLAIEDAPDYAIVFNVARAKALGIEVPESLLTAADQVYLK